MAQLTRLLVAVAAQVATAQVAGPAGRALPVAKAAGSAITSTLCPPQPHPGGDGGVVRLVRHTLHDLPILHFLHSALHPPPRWLLTTG
jgi:hypothetical protein